MGRRLQIQIQSKPLIDKVVAPIRYFTDMQASAGILLLLATICALIWANSDYSEHYFKLWQQPITVGFGSYTISKSLMLLINDGLMAIFFFVVGLEIKREVIAGELNSPKQAALPIAAAIGGMVVPTLIYWSLNAEGPAKSGWGIPMATDIAFAIGVLVLLGSRVPAGIKVFLTALAIVDDLGAVLIIAFFYTSELSVLNLAIGALFLVLLVACNLSGVRHSLVYATLGIGGLWLAFLFSGVHPTIAGVLAAFTIPANTRINRKEFLDLTESAITEFKETPENENFLSNSAQQNAISTLTVATELTSAPLFRLEHALHPWVMFVVMPIFAFANAGVTIEGSLLQSFSSPLSLGIILGLVFGKQIGITLFAWLSVKFKLASLPANTTWRHIYGAACLGGIGFTMSLFIASLAFGDSPQLPPAKTAILIASTIAGVFGVVVLLMGKKKLVRVS
jgi:NhaA family Na+:H+ antiporter